MWIELKIKKIPEKKNGIFHESEKYEDFCSIVPFINSNRNKKLAKKGILGNKTIAK